MGMYNIPKAIKKLQELQSEHYVLAECDYLQIVVHTPEFGVFFDSKIESCGFSGEKPVFVLGGQFESVAPKNYHYIAASENLDLLVSKLEAGEHPLNDSGMQGKGLLFVIK